MDPMGLVSKYIVSITGGVPGFPFQVPVSWLINWDYEVYLLNG